MSSVKTSASVRTGIVAIGRNEGDRLRACLDSIRTGSIPFVYVDSGSSDGSVGLAKSMGAHVLALDPSKPFSAARARNEGFDQLLELWPGLAYVQFVDGDCELAADWPTRGQLQLDAQLDVGAVCGQVQEKDWNASIYTRLCAMEWEKTPGEVAACGGNCMVRVNDFRLVGGFRPDVIAGEEGEFCLRLRRAGRRILHLAHPMVRHDVATTRFAQWWQRARRAGHAYAQGAALHGRAPERHFMKECRSIWFWGLLLPVVSLGLAVPTSGASLLLIAGYPVLAARVYRAGRRRGWTKGDAALYAAFAILAKLPGLQGLLQYHWRILGGRDMAIIEHKKGGRES